MRKDAGPYPPGRQGEDDGPWPSTSLMQDDGRRGRKKVFFMFAYILHICLVNLIRLFTHCDSKLGFKSVYQTAPAIMPSFKSHPPSYPEIDLFLRA